MEGTTMTSSLRDRYNAFIARHEIAWELLFGGLALLWVAIGFMDQQYGASSAIAALEIALWAVFFLEFTTRLAASRDQRAYARAHLIDAIALIPAVRGLRLLRLLRRCGSSARSLASIAPACSSSGSRGTAGLPCFLSSGWR